MLEEALAVQLERNRLQSVARGCKEAANDEQISPLLQMMLVPSGPPSPISLRMSLMVNTSPKQPILHY